MEINYIAAMYTRVDDNYKDRPERLYNIISYIASENERWDNLISIASGSSSVNWQEGTIGAAMQMSREMELRKYRIYNQWKNWLTYLDTSAVLPEPAFIGVHGWP